MANSHSHKVIGAQVKQLSEQLEAAKQRELELLAVIADMRWRLEDVREMLMSTGVTGQRMYGCDEWSTPTVNLQLALDQLAKPTSQALREHDAKVLTPESKRLDFVLDNLCVIQSKKTDSGTGSYQLMSQNEDEEFFTLHNPDDFFKSSRDAIDASIRMAEERRRRK